MRDIQIGSWLHCAPERDFRDGRRAIVKRLCFGPLESWSFGVTADSGYFREVRILEGTDERSLSSISLEELREAIAGEIRLCRKHQGEDLAALLQAELETLE